MLDHVFCDTETTGLNPDTHEIWEFGGIRRSFEGSPHFDAGKVAGVVPNPEVAGEHLQYSEKEKVLQIVVDMSLADPFALKVGNFYERSQQYRARRSFIGDSERYALDTIDAAIEIEEFTHGATLLGLNIAFDFERLGRLMRNNGVCPSFHYHPVDISASAAAFLAASRGTALHTSHTNIGLSEALNVPVPEGMEKHSALGDARWAMAIWDAMKS